MGFGDKMKSWLKGCLESSKSSVLFNGSPTEEFPISKGVKQGDPLSPFLFIAVMEGLSAATRAACDTRIFHVLGNLPSYYLSLFVAPEGIIDTLENMRNQFLWEGSDEKKVIHWISWDKVTTSKKSDGLGVGTIKALNVALITKWWWSVRQTDSKQWSHLEMWANPGWIFHSKCSQIKMDYQTPLTNIKFHWIKEIPLKVSCFIWRAHLGKIPTAKELVKSRVSMENLTCQMCNEKEESVDHILVDCAYAKKVMERIMRWCKVNIHTGDLQAVSDVLNFANQWGTCTKKRKIFLAFCYSTLRRIRIAMNEKVFKKNQLLLEKVIEYIKYVTFLWVKNTTSRKSHRVYQICDLSLGEE
uniref:Reverse transcriptase zinc-binding domain-containing protein n=1 Tax=Lactuca sativa TaxID=4236 RepID=A0A9R1XBN9_LACSA|nr:hypothetical protein LSAT_V11C500290840 [Lactuca sativa]